MTFGPYMGTSALFSEDGTHRYQLFRRWAPGPVVMFVAWNPSDADEKHDDPTIRKEVGFAMRWGFGALFGMNALSFISTDPKGLRRAEVVRRRTDEVLRATACLADKVVVAWGGGLGFDRSWRVLDLLAPYELLCIGRTKDGAPLHPSRVGYTDAPRLYRGVRAAVSP